MANGLAEGVVIITFSIAINPDSASSSSLVTTALRLLCKITLAKLKVQMTNKEPRSTQPAEPRSSRHQRLIK